MTITAGRSHFSDKRATAVGNGGEIISYTLAALSGLLYVFCFPPTSFHFLAWVCLVPLFLGIRRVSGGHAFMSGMIFGMTIAASIYWWLPKVLMEYFGLFPWWSALIGLILAYYAAVPYGLLALWLSWVSRDNAAAPWIVAAGWGAMEYCIQDYWIPFPIGLLSQAAFPSPVIQVADLAGQVGVSLVVVLANAGLATLGGLGRARRGGRRIALSWIGVGAVVACALSYGHWRQNVAEVESEPVRVALVQGGVESEMRLAPTMRHESRQQYLRLTKEVLEEEAPDFVLWPENAAGSYLQKSDSKLAHELAELSSDHPVDLFVGGPYSEKSGGREILSNSIFAFQSGQISQRYDKVGLLPFAESNPFQNLLRSERNRFTRAGVDYTPLESRSGPIGFLICSEAALPRAARKLTNHGARILANPSNDSWLPGGSAMELQLQMASLRAIENRRYFLRVTTTGVSAILDPAGRVVARLERKETGIVSREVFGSRRTTLYQFWGDLIARLCIVMVLLVSLAYSKLPFLGVGVSRPAPKN